MLNLEDAEDIDGMIASSSRVRRHSKSGSLPEFSH